MSINIRTPLAPMTCGYLDDGRAYALRGYDTRQSARFAMVLLKHIEIVHCDCKLGSNVNIECDEYGIKPRCSGCDALLWSQTC